MPRKVVRTGKLIVIEGGDASGKTTQTKLFLSRLIGQARMFDFPRYYTSLAGKLVGECLAGEHGDFLHLSPYLASLPYTVDRIGARDALLHALEHHHVVCNRYVTSNVAHQGAKLMGEERGKFIDFLEKLEYDELKLPRPDAVFYLHVPMEIADTLGKGKAARDYLRGTGKTLDQHEADLEYQKRVIALYTELALNRPDWHLIPCTQNGALLHAEVIHEKIWNIFTTL